MVKPNEGSLDRIAHLALATVLLPAGLVWLGGLQGNLGDLFAAVVGMITLITGPTGVCPTYNLFGISTVEIAKNQGVPPRGN